MSSPLHFPLASAYLCVGCNCVGNCSRRCPACASEVLMGLAGILNREAADAPMRVIHGEPVRLPARAVMGAEMLLGEKP